MNEPRLCCNCLHCARWRKKDGIECHCDLNDKYLGYLTVMDEENDCKHWEKETKWDLQREHDAKIRAEVIDECKNNVELFREIFMEELEGLAVSREEVFMYRDVCSIAWNKYLEQLKEQKND